MEKIQGLNGRFPADPHLPTGRVRVLFAACSQEAETRLRAMGVTVLHPAPEPALEPELRTHADLVCCTLGSDSAFVSATQTSLLAAISALGGHPTVVPPPATPYPGDVRLNVLTGKNYALGRFRHTDSSLLDTLRKSGRSLLDVRQGYAKCAVCPIEDDACITDDPGIAKVLRTFGKDVLLTEKGDVALSDRHFGFFGGAAGMLAPNLLVVNGSLRFHRDEKQIRSFLAGYGVELLELTDGRITDIGGLIPLTEEML